MADIEATVRDLVNRDHDCTDKALAQIGLRGKINLLIGEWRAAGGGEMLPDIRDRVRLRPQKSESRPARLAAPR
jgi:hypothetical protein